MADKLVRQNGSGAQVPGYGPSGAKALSPARDVPSRVATEADIALWLRWVEMYGGGGR